MFQQIANLLAFTPNTYPCSPIRSGAYSMTMLLTNCFCSSWAAPAITDAVSLPLLTLSSATCFSCSACNPLQLLAVQCLRGVSVLQGTRHTAAEYTAQESRSEGNVGHQSTECSYAQQCLLPMIISRCTSLKLGWTAGAAGPGKVLDMELHPIACKQPAGIHVVGSQQLG